MPDDAMDTTDEPFPERTWLLIRVLPGGTPGAIKMRHALKAMLRSYGLRCERITPAGPTNEPPKSTEGEPL